MRKGIRNIVFDMGKVIIGFDPEVFMDREKIFDEEDRHLIKEKIYQSKMWLQMDMGDLKEEEMIEKVTPEFPEHLRPHIRNLIAGWPRPLIEIPGMNELIFGLKDRAYGIYLLSNASVMQKEYWKTVPCAKCFDGTVVSAFEHLMKPDKRFYELLLKRYDLKAEECLFIDDRRINVDAAASLGFDTFLFEGDSAKLKEYIEN
ncbi:MAG: HAD family phosphatase [Erysipelotrichaceae bacterium]|nr:HAD family phosphatase [Erysipelotrichaceae bacterium]